ncbi:hypothetical protein GUITHDRAFT_100705 [Guillardia theta CCMP2712]|uniref:Uncharacterized protein n=1 Tax=Guillardia theta (strain CCMP2712) TaxID=905079 RepID=L1JZF1_GUITC|nr:hypothetical protein GUITHDRAFT_100705 [Guillardia theta CCMP2712]EKX53737.1 hypothetical protein GUITHDRAFT_100705 [Guillardia theta CCMP2712]|eukprot:XP_005840717.1 hypothetical protein GUITHDRAFT_100705 [Guillardia theta CCMP2712]
MRRGKLGGSAFAGLEMMCSNGGIELALTSITFRRTLADRHAMEIAVEHLSILRRGASEKIRKHRAAYAMTTPPRAFIPLAISTDGTLHPDTLRFIWYLADIIAQRSMPLEDAAFGRHFVPDDGPAAEVLARKRAATYQRLTMQLTLEALLSGARRMTPLRAQALLEPEDSSSSDFVESPEESSPEVSDSDGGHPSAHSEKLHNHKQNTSPKTTPSHPHGRKMKGDIHIPGIRDRGSEQYEGLMVHPVNPRSMPLEDAAFGRHFVPDDGPAAEWIYESAVAETNTTRDGGDAASMPKDPAGLCGIGGRRARTSRSKHPSLGVGARRECQSADVAATASSMSQTFSPLFEPVGPLEDAVAAASAMKKYILADLKLEIQPRESSYSVRRR